MAKLGVNTLGAHVRTRACVRTDVIEDVNCPPYLRSQACGELIQAVHFHKRYFIRDICKHGSERGKLNLFS